ncbi:MAG TPA: copper oxidase [Blastocatellia bacterium]|nr:copper oxidase [Blastocatellia bacterium]
MKAEHVKRGHARFVLLIGAALAALLLGPGKAAAQDKLPVDEGGGGAAVTCTRYVVADVVALDQPFFWNRFGAVQPQGMIFALRRDVVPIPPATTLSAGNVMLRKDKRPRPMVLRMNVGDCLQIKFQNLLATAPKDMEQPATRAASVRAIGLQLVNSILSDGSNVGSVAPPGSLVQPGGSAIYTFYAEREGSHMLYSAGTTTGGEGDGGSLDAGLFGSVNVQAANAEYYRSQVTEDDLKIATTGYTRDGHPTINYGKLYPSTHPRANTPVLKMTINTGTNTKEIVHTDLTAIVTGPNAGRFPTGTYKANATEPDRDQPFREFTIIYHDEIGAVQAFPQFEQQPLKHTLHSVRDAFAFNYGTGGIGAEILANRIGVGPTAPCVECKFEEFFLASWVVGDPAMVVDKPANAPCKPENIRNPVTNPCTPDPGFKATQALYPDDPSNVYHSYIRDHLKMRIVHGGAKEHHVHHLHAHQWLRTPDSDNSSYLDSQSLGPGYSFTTEITYNGTGNRNQVVGDSIFHCHFYPHFAMGMWALWRSHDVFEFGTKLDSTGRPALGSRALPDAEIKVGTPIPGLVPLPTRPMAPLPQATATISNGQVVVTGSGNPGYPFFVPAVAGHRPPKPPLDTVDDGGLPRHVINGGTALFNNDPAVLRLDFNKTLLTADATARPEGGTSVELAAMAYHAIRKHPTCLPDGQCDVLVDPLQIGKNIKFITNGLPAKSGAPYADPCLKTDINDNVVAFGNPRTYKAAAFQFDLTLNKEGWHFPQQRILTLWRDVAPTKAGTIPAQPFFFRAKTDDCITFHHTNLMPAHYALDDYQVLTPTDIVGQHIHLVKFDVTSSDGSGNGFNYEDGTFAPEEVLERIAAINALGGLKPFTGTVKTPLIPKPHPFFGTLGAQTTIQRWFADDTLNNAGVDRTLRTVFTHDHFGPSTHQQVGLYAGLVIEPKGSLWRDSETGIYFPDGRDDGGPTSWRADIIMPNAADTYREFLLEFADFQHAYKKGGGVNGAGNPVPDPNNVINPPAKQEAGLPFLIERMPICPGGFPLPCPEAISAAEPGTMVVNYRNEPVALRVRDPLTNTQAGGLAGDLAHVFRSNVTRADGLLNVQPTGPPWPPKLTGGLFPGDPFTPLLRTYQKDKTQIRILVGAHEEGHNFSVHGTKWLFEPNVRDSGWKNSQMMGISEHYEFELPRFLTGTPPHKFTDFLYTPGAAVEDLWNGLWGMLRVYHVGQPDLKKLPNNDVDALAAVANTLDYSTAVQVPDDPTVDPSLTTTTVSTVTITETSLDGPTTTETSTTSATTSAISPTGWWINIVNKGVCPRTAPLRILDVSAVLARDALASGTLTYNSRATTVRNLLTGETHVGPLHDPTAILYVRSRDLDRYGKLYSSVPIEPLVLRANAGDCIAVILRNKLLNGTVDLDGFSTLPFIIDEATTIPSHPYFNANQVKPSAYVGLHPQLVAYDPTRADGNNVGFNDVQTPAPGGLVGYLWYAGHVNVEKTGTVTFAPVEFGASNLISADRIKHSNKGAFGSLIIEPAGSTWIEDPPSLTPPLGSRAMATVTTGTKSFREFVAMFQNDINLRYSDGGIKPIDPVEVAAILPWPQPVPSNPAVPNLKGADDAEDSGQAGVNYRTEPIWFRMGHTPDTPFEITRTITNFDTALNNAKVGGDPQTPVFRANAGAAVRIRLLMAGAHARNNVFTLHGHIWQEEPWISTLTTPSVFQGDNLLSEWNGSQFGIGATSHFNFLLRNGAGGKFGVRGDYLFRTFQSFQFDNGIWGLFRVQ